MCSAEFFFAGPVDQLRSHMHNNVHDWVGGQMDVIPSAVNKFNFHHCNVLDRISGELDEELSEEGHRLSTICS